MTCIHYADDAFGDRYDINELPLPRLASGYAVQRLDTDTLLDRLSGKFLPVRSASAQPLFASFDEAHAAAGRWVSEHCINTEEHGLAIVPVGIDDTMQRHILIYGVLRTTP